MAEDSGEEDVSMPDIENASSEEIRNLPEIVSIFDSLDKEEKILTFIKILEGEKVSEIVEDVDASSSTVYNYIDGFRAAGVVKKDSSARSGYSPSERGEFVYKTVKGMDMRIQQEMVQKLTATTDTDLEKLQEQLDSTEFDEGSDSGFLGDLFSSSSNL